MSVEFKKASCRIRVQKRGCAVRKGEWRMLSSKKREASVEPQKRVASVEFRVRNREW